MNLRREQRVSYTTEQVGRVARFDSQRDASMRAIEYVATVRIFVHVGDYLFSRQYGYRRTISDCAIEDGSFGVLDELRQSAVNALGLAIADYLAGPLRHFDLTIHDGKLIAHPDHEWRHS